ncbi:hypothetical protein AN958_07302 [Leucoagaricus sp. SymC.cos]|nr:hypothetical protein AN958_07302 [Leucoagaricus sp. SymC.cos]
MHGGPHYSIRRLASTHPFEDPQEHVEEVTHHNAEPLHDALTCRFFMRPPDEAPTIKYGAVVRDILEEVDLLHMSLISMQNSHPLPDVLELTNSCRQVVSRLSDIVSDPILFAGSFTEYYIHFLREFLVDEDRAIENVRYALAGGIPSIVQACEKEREKIIEAKHVFRAASAELCKFLYTHDGTDTRIATNHPFTLKNVQALNLVLHKFDLMDQFCRSYEEYFGHEQFHHLHNLLHDFKFDLISRPSPREYDAMIQVWTRFERFTLHFPNELDTMTEFFKFNSTEGYTSAWMQKSGAQM